jgi:hypothetical protein
LSPEAMNACISTWTKEVLCFGVISTNIY